MYKYCAWGMPSAQQYILNFPRLQLFKQLHFFAPLHIHRLINHFHFFLTVTVSTIQRRLLQRFDSVDSIDFFHNTTTIFSTL